MLEDEIKELEKLGKPIVRFLSIEIVDFANYKELRMTLKNDAIKVLTREVIIKEGILITDDFIFIKD